jgi:hypothetical protein
MMDRLKRSSGPASTNRGAPQWTLSDEDRAVIRAGVAALPPPTDEQVDALCEIIIAARKRPERKPNRLRRWPQTRRVRVLARRVHGSSHQRLTYGRPRVGPEQRQEAPTMVGNAQGTTV